MAKVNTLMRMPDATTKNLNKLKNILNVLKDTKVSLHSLGIDTSSWDPIINAIVQPRLDNQTIELFEQ